MKLPAIATLVAASFFMSGCAVEEPELLEPEPAPVETEMTEPDVHPLSWYEERFSNEKERLKQANEVLVGCMAFNGFDYIPEPSFDNIFVTSEGPGWGSLEYATEYGYGLIQSPMIPEEPAEMWDPEGLNAIIYTGFSTAEQEEYVNALEGDEITGKLGCRDEARDMAFHSDPLRVYDDEEFAELFQSLEMLPDEVFKDSRMVELRDEWLSCMQLEGFDELGDRPEAQAALSEELGTLENASEIELDEFMQREISIATADATCAIETDWDQTVGQITADVETQFVAEHYEELEAVITKYGLDD